MLDNKDFEEKAWGSMLELLDKEMPEKKAFPWFRSLLLLLLLLLVGGGIAYSYISSDDVKEYAGKTPSAIASTINNQEIKTDRNLSIDTNPKTASLNEEESSRSVNLVSTESEQSSAKQSKIVRTSSLSSANSTSKVPLDTSALIENEVVNTPIEKSTTLVYASKFQTVEKQKVEQSIENSTSALLSTNAVLSESTLELKSLATLINPIDFSSIQNVADDQKLLLQLPSSTRRTSLYAASEVGYNTDFQSLATSIGLIGEIGASNSPLSFSTGLVYERYSLQSVSNTVYTNVLEDELIETGSTPEVDKIEASDASTLLSIAYLSVPLQFHYRFNYIKLGLGIENKFLVNQQLRNGYVRAEASNQFAGSADRNSVAFGPNKYHLTANQSIAVRIRPRIDLGLHFQYDLTGIFSESAFTLSNRNASNRLDNVGISLAYKLK